MQNEIRQPLVNTARRIQGVRKVEGQQVKNNVCNSPCNSPSKLVDQYLAEPMEVELKSLKEELDVHKEIVDGTQDGKMRSGKCNGNDDLKDAQLIESLRSTHLDSQEIRDDKFVLELDQETSGLVFFMSEDAEKQPITLANLNVGRIRHLLHYLIHPYNDYLVLSLHMGKLEAKMPCTEKLIVSQPK